ncbi:PliI family lysozyme inhibitor of I-type lysozyme [Shewanella sp. UCD-KL12]|uniref:PliI family lysozyme inhibitor of I-type lysozyme n=1 Tax=Shewanella sp. UCD-KL12 TaxID=1917163 RepID=UPI0009712BB7|nr:PliI family lysozyme inhibitor of I-type lysozyme [Shewanella sp. UCD-KL12]
MHKFILVTLITLMVSACSASIYDKSSEGTETPSSLQHTAANMSGVYLERLELASGYTLVIAEGALEPRSIGSVTVKMYRDLVVGDFVSGLSFPRDGTVLKSVLIGNSSDKQTLSITTVTAGSGNYQSTQLICIDGETLSLC